MEMAGQGHHPEELTFEVSLLSTLVAGQLRPHLRSSINKPLLHTTPFSECLIGYMVTQEVLGLESASL